MQNLFKSGKKACFAITGGGTSFIKDLTSQSGASNFLLEYYVPYSKEAFDAFVGGPIDKYVSRFAANKLALTAYMKAWHQSSDPLGVGITASIASEGEREGRQHDYYLTLISKTDQYSISGHFNQGLSREEEEEEIKLDLKGWLDYICLNKTEEGYTSKKMLSACHITSIPEWFNQKLFSYGTKDKSSINLVFPGSFNPIHKGHVRMMEIAESFTGRKGAYEISIGNVDKGYISYSDCLDRMRYREFVISNDILFKDKVINYPEGTFFIVGEDTYKRIFDESYYSNTAEYNSAMQIFRLWNTQFLVFSRNGSKVANGEFILECQEASDFDIKVSSTELRK
tara:strand:+ start:31742 stop:32761 length:1020 start_codon:yes stop_codon:yes gene_type:complete